MADRRLRLEQRVQLTKLRRERAYHQACLAHNRLAEAEEAEARALMALDKFNQRHAGVQPLTEKKS